LGFFDEEKNVKDYIKMAEGYDGAELIVELQKHLIPNSTVLELGMGPGVDLDILKKTYQVTGSDNSQIFIDRYKKKDPNAHVVLLDAVTIKTDIKFDCIYSNKVLMHLSKEELKKSFKRQKEILSDRGILFHSFWYGNKEEEHYGLRFVYYTETELENLLIADYEIIKMKIYKEMKKDDSILVIAKKRI
jgi:cyclopropane fatty-acyl-phospholipid synthase-like methyltransferase